VIYSKASLSIVSFSSLLITSTCVEPVASDIKQGELIKTESDRSPEKSVNKQNLRTSFKESEGMRKENRVKMNIVDIIPGKSIGKLHLGLSVDEIVPAVPLTANVGELDGIKYTIRNGKVDDVWIDDLRTFKGEVRFQESVIPHDVPLEKLKELFGNCEQVEGIKGGNFFNCAIGITIGCDFRGQGEFIQLRLKPR
jgi:hypothetical protein